MVNRTIESLRNDRHPLPFLPSLPYRPNAPQPLRFVIQSDLLQANRTGTVWPKRPDCKLTAAAVMMMTNAFRGKGENEWKRADQEREYEQEMEGNPVPREEEEDILKLERGEKANSYANRTRRRWKMRINIWTDRDSNEKIMRERERRAAKESMATKWILTRKCKKSLNLKKF